MSRDHNAVRTLNVRFAAGASGIWVTNHGGRQIDGGPAAFDSLQEVAEAVDKRVPIVFDSGIRRGQHVFKALASGADLVAIGRPVIYGLALGGSVGVRQVFEHLNAELKNSHAIRLELRLLKMLNTLNFVITHTTQPSQLTHAT